MSDHATEDLKGTAKEMAGKLTGSDEMVKEGQAQQEKAEHAEKAENAKDKQDAHSGS